MKRTKFGPHENFPLYGNSCTVAVQQELTVCKLISSISKVRSSLEATPFAAREKVDQPGKRRAVMFQEDIQ